MEREIIVKRNTGSKTFHVSVITQGEKEVVVNEVVFENGKPTLPEDKTYHMTQSELEAIVKEMFLGIEDDRLPDDVKQWPIGKREDFIDMFNASCFWYWKADDAAYDVNKPLAVNTLSYAYRMAYEYVQKREDEGVYSGEKQTQESSRGNEHGKEQPQFRPIAEKCVGFVRAGEITTSSDGGYDIPLQIIEGGWTLNGEYVTQEALEDVARLVSQKTPGYFKHGDYNRDARDWSLVVEEGHVEGNTVQGKAHVFQYPDGVALKERIDYATKNNAQHLFGVSIDAWAKIEEGEVDGREGIIIKNFVNMHSVDVVMLPAANGRFGKTTQSVQHPTHNTKETKMDLETLKKEHPELVNFLIEEGRKEVQEGDLKALQEKVDEAKVTQAEYEAKIAEYETKIAEYEAKEKAVAFAQKVRQYVSDELNQQLATDGFVASLIAIGEDKWEVIEKIVQERKNLNVGGPTNMGPDQPGEQTTNTQDEMSAEERKKLFLSQIN